MNENLNLVEILKDCPKGTKFYSLIYGDVELEKISNDENDKYPIFIRLTANTIDCVAKDGRYIGNYDGECVLFPSKDQRDWSKFNIKKPKFDPKTLQPFDKVLTKSLAYGVWQCDFFQILTTTIVILLITVLVTSINNAFPTTMTPSTL